MSFERVMLTILAAIGAATLVGLSRIKELVKMSPSQEKFDEQVGQLNTKLDGIGTALQGAAEVLNKVGQDVAAERQQVADFIAANPQVDTSALAGVTSRLDSIASTVDSQSASLSGLDTSVGDIFTPPAVEVEVHEEPAGGGDQGESGGQSTTDAGADTNSGGAIPSGEAGSQPAGDGSAASGDADGGAAGDGGEGA